MKLILRVTSPEGRSRLEVDDQISITELIQKVDPKSQFKAIHLEDGRILSNSFAPISSLSLKNGHQIKVAGSRDSFGSLYRVSTIDDLLDRETGMITRRQDPQFCKHTSTGMCDYCMPLEPYDQKYLEQNKIKYTSWHAYLKRLRTSNKSSIHLAPLDPLDFKVQNPCRNGNHLPWPRGICSKCQPSSVTLTTQNFRMLDHVEFEVPLIVEGFLDSWRKSGSQRFGYLFGKYAPYDKVPLGVKAIVAAIYETPQQGQADCIQLSLPDNNEESIKNLAARFGLVCVGMIYTDLIDAGKGDGTVLCKRHAESYFMSSAECVMSAQHQLRNPCLTKYASAGLFSSRFVTCVLSGDMEGKVDMNVFQVTSVAEAMVRDDIVEACIDPTLMRVKESTGTHYVPEVFYKYKNEYGVFVQEAAKPTFPVDYLLVTQTHGFPLEANYTFKSYSFPIENRTASSQYDFSLLKRHFTTLAQANAKVLSDTLSDFHLLAFLATCGIMDDETMNSICAVAKGATEENVRELMGLDGWGTLMAILEETSAISTAPKASSGSRSIPSEWACRHCTFHNRDSDLCEMCGLPNE